MPLTVKSTGEREVDRGERAGDGVRAVVEREAVALDLRVVDRDPRQLDVADLVGAARPVAEEERVAGLAQQLRRLRRVERQRAREEAADRELGPEVGDRLEVQRAARRHDDRDVEVAALVERADAGGGAVHDPREVGGRSDDRELLVLLDVLEAVAGDREAALGERDGDRAEAEVAAQQVAVAAAAEAGRVAALDRDAVGAGEAELPAVDRVLVDRVAGAARREELDVDVGPLVLVLEVAEVRRGLGARRDAPAAGRPRRGDVAGRGELRAGREEVADRAGGGVDEHRRLRRVDRGVAAAGAAERELVRGVRDRRHVEREAGRRRREGDDERRRAEVARVERRRGRRGRRAQRPGAGEEVHEHVALGPEDAVDPVAHGARDRVPDDRLLGRVEPDAAEPGAAERELRREVGDRVVVDRVAGGRRGERDVDPAAVVDRVEVDRAAVERADEVGRRAGDDDLERRRVAGVAAAVGPAVVGEVDRDRARLVGRGQLAEAVAEARHAGVAQQRLALLGERLAPVDRVAGGVAHGARGDQAGVGVGDELDRDRAAVERAAAERAGERELVLVVQDRAVVEVGARRRRVEHVDVEPAVVAVGVGDADVEQLAALERRRQVRARRHDRERAVGLDAGAGRVAPCAGREQDLVLADLERAVDVEAEQVRARQAGRRLARQCDCGAADAPDQDVGRLHRADLDGRVRARREQHVDVAAPGAVVHDHRRRQVLAQRLAGRLVDRDPAVLRLAEADPGADAADPEAVRALVAVGGDQQRPLRQVEADRGAARLQHEVLGRVGDRGLVEPEALRRRELDVDEAAAVELRHRDRVAGARAAQAGGRLRGRLARDDELDLAAGRVAEAHLQAAVHRQQLDLLGHVGEEQHRHLARADAREVRVEPAGDRDVVVGEVELADDQELAVGRDLDDDLAVEQLLARVDRVDLRAAGDRHRRRERGREAVHLRVVAQQQRLVGDLLLDRAEPLVGRLADRQLERGPAQLLRLVDRRQRLEELDAGEEVVDREADLRHEQDAGGQAHAELDRQRAELGQREPDREPAHAGHREAALDADEQDPLLDRGRRVERVDHAVGRVELEDPADQLRRELAAEHVALDRDADRRDVDDRELAVEQLPDVDLDALDRARELQAGDPLDLLDRRRQRQREVGRVGLDVRPLDPDVLDLDREP